MSDYKLVPVEPTAEMVEAAEDAYMPFGDMELAVRMAVLAAPQPAEQQPVYRRCEYCDGTGDVHSLDGEWRGACDCPAGQQPEPISRNLRAVHAMILNALDRDAAEGKAVRGEMAAELRSALSEQQPSPDVARLVGALEASTHRLHEQADGEDDCRCSQCRFVRLRDAAIAAHRKQGGE